MRKLLIAGNWKMNCGPAETEKLLGQLKNQLSELPNSIQVLVCPPSISLTVAANNLKTTDILLGAQNVHFEDNGAYTGEISTQMLAEIDCEYVIVGHSERRGYFGETDEIVNAKAKKVLDAGMKPIICVGESLKQRKDNEYAEVVTRQIETALKGIDDVSGRQFVIAYEPIWAIGTGETATPEQAGEMHGMIREVLAKLDDQKTADAAPVLYGGSMKPHNAGELLKQSNVDGGLIGGASLKADSFAEIIGIAQGLET